MFDRKDNPPVEGGKEKGDTVIFVPGREKNLEIHSSENDFQSQGCISIKIYNFVEFTNRI